MCPSSTSPTSTGVPLILCLCPDQPALQQSERLQSEAAERPQAAPGTGGNTIVTWRGIIFSLTAGGRQPAGALLARGHRGGQGLPGGPRHCLDDQQVIIIMGETVLRRRNDIFQHGVVSPTRRGSLVDRRPLHMQLQQNAKYTHSEIF